MEAWAQIPAGEEPARVQDAQLIAAVLRKDRKATAEFVARCSDWLYPFVWRRLSPCTDMVQDLMQEILISARQSLSNYRGEADLRAWILGIARHKVDDYYRRRIREAELKEDVTVAGIPDPMSFRTGDSGMGMTHGTIAGILISDLIQGRVGSVLTLHSCGGHEVAVKTTRGWPKGLPL
jgi:RNA polymerase sigma factor (sigma-70 family)